MNKVILLSSHTHPNRLKREVLSTHWTKWGARRAFNKRIEENKSNFLLPLDSCVLLQVGSEIEAFHQVTEEAPSHGFGLL